MRESLPVERRDPVDRKYSNKVKELQENNDQKGLSKLERYKSDLASDARKEVRRSIEKELNDRSRHDEVVGKIGSIFLDEEITEETGYRLKTYEHLYEVPLEESGHKIADLLIYNPEKNNALFFEVKTGSLSGAFGEMKTIKETVHEKQDRLERILGESYSEATCEFGLVVDQKNVAGTVKDHIEHSHDEGIPLFFYRSNTLRLHETWSLKDEELEKRLKEGITREGGSATTITPNSHEFNILHQTLIEIFRKNLMEGKEEVKNFTKQEFKDVFFDLVTIRAFEEDSPFGRALSRRVEDIIEKGLEYSIIKKRNENRFRIYVRGKKDYEKLINNLKRKWINEYVENNWERRAERMAYLKFENKKKTKKLDDFT